MFKQCCGCKGRPDPDTDDEKEKLQEVEKKNSVTINVKEEKAEVTPEVVVSLPDSSPLPEVKNEAEEAPLLKKEEPPKETKNPGLTIDTSQDLEGLDDDDDNMIVPITPRTAKGLTPHPAKRNSTPGLSAIPKWLSQDDDEESGGTAEPPVTPVGRDELALRRHRFFSDLLVAAQAATEHRVRFDPLGPSVADKWAIKNNGAAESSAHRTISHTNGLRFSSPAVAPWIRLAFRCSGRETEREVVVTEGRETPDHETRRDGTGGNESRDESIYEPEVCICGGV
ncbi:F-actin-capping protein subunit alpha [Homalodisca vitripennis]|nr:F-actin-capping protein subunit alpha [Homalodisca vitripennis]